MSLSNPAGGRTLSQTEIQGLQDSLSASITTAQNSAKQCPDKTQSDQLADQAQQMSDHYDDLESQLFSVQTKQVSDDAGTAFDGTKSYTAQLSALSASLDQYSKILTLAGQVVGAATQLIKLL